MSMAIAGELGSTTATELPVGPQHHAVTTATVYRAVRRDLDRAAVTLGDPMTSVRRAALVQHIGFLLDQLVAVHLFQDEELWPAAVAHRPHLVDLADRSARGHAALAGPMTALRQAAATWKRAPITRTVVRSAVRDLLPALDPVAGHDVETVPLACAILPEDAWAGIERTRQRFVPPTRVARRLFWLLDDLPPAQAELLLAPTPGWRLWVLRNGFSGAYNRAAYLMWIGGGNGPAV